MRDPVKNIFTKHFDSLGEFVKYTVDTPCPWKSAEQSSKRAPSDWSGNVTFEQAVKLSENGWRQGRDKLSKELDGMKALTGIASARAIDYDVAGHLPDVPRAVAGLPDCMINHGAVEQRAKPIIRMLVNIGFNCSISEKTIISYGAAILSYIDQLEENGYSVELSTYWESHGYNGHGMLATVILKQAGEPLEIDRMAFCLIHPAYLRKLHFKYLETEIESEKYAGSYGTPQNTSKKLLREQGYNVSFNELETNFYSPKEAIAYVKNIIDKNLNGQQGAENEE